MAVNDLTFNQLSMVLNSIVQQATGQQAQQVTNTAEFVSVAQTALKTGYDPVLQAISQVLSRTIFSIRPYTRKFGGLMVSNQQFGNIVRKLNIADKDWEEDSRFELTDQNSVDMYKVNKPTILQTNFYGANVFEKSLTIFKDQLLTEYNTITGLKSPLTAETVYQPANFKPFMQWVYSRVASLSSLMTERTQKFHINVTGKEISRHTPVNKQKVYLYAPARYQTETMVLADVYHDNFLRMADNETVNFWQSIDKPDEINVQPVYLQADGTLKSDDTPLNQKGIFGVMFDEEAAGYTVVNQWSAPTPFNSKGGYSNIFWHFTDRYWNDFTENGIVLLLD